MEAKDVIISLSVVMLFIVAMISFGGNFASENNAAISITNDSRINTLYTGVNSTVFGNVHDNKTLEETANESNGLLDEPDTLGDKIQDWIGDKVLGFGKAIFGVVYNMFNAILDPLLRIIIPGSAPARRAIGVVITSIFSFLMGFVIYKLIRTGR